MVMRIFSWLLAVLLGLFGLGCTVTLTGGGELSVGMRNDNFLVFRHTVDGDKEGKEAKSDLDVDPVLKSLIGGVPPVPEDSGSDEDSDDVEAANTESESG